MGTFWGHFGDILGTLLLGPGACQDPWDFLPDMCSIFSASIFTWSCILILFMFWFLVFFSRSCFKKKHIVFCVRKAITWGYPLVIAPYNESVGLLSFDSSLPFYFQKKFRHFALMGDVEGRSRVSSAAVDQNFPHQAAAI